MHFKTKIKNMVKHKILKKLPHEGKITIEKNVNVAVLEDGTRLITQSVIFKAFDVPKRGRALDDIRVLNRPAL
jgi:glutamate 5-kinase